MTSNAAAGSVTSGKTRIIVLVAALAGLAVAFGPGATTIGLALSLALGTIFSIPVGVVTALILKPGIDCLWSTPVLGIGDLQLNPQSIVGLLVPPAILLGFLRARHSWRPTTLEWTIVGYGFVTMLGIVISPAKGAAVSDAAKVILPFLFILGGRALRLEGLSVSQLCVLLASYGIIPAITGLLELIGILAHPVGAEPTPAGVFRISGFYHHPLDIAIRCSLAIPFALALVSMARDRLLRAGMAVWSVFMIAISFATLVRSALGIISVELVAWAWLRGRRVLSAVVVGGAVVTMLVVPPIQRVIQDAVRPIQEGEIYQFGTGRALLYAAQVAAFEQASPVQKILGRGLHSSQASIVNYSPVRVTVLEQRFEGGGGVGSHNQYLRVLGEHGIIGLAVFLAVAFQVFRVSLRLVHGGHTKEARLLATATFAAMFAMVAFGMALTPFDSPGFTWPLWLAVGYLLSLDASQPVVSNRGVT